MNACANFATNRYNTYNMYLHTLPSIYLPTQITTTHFPNNLGWEPVRPDKLTLNRLACIIKSSRDTHVGVSYQLSLISVYTDKCWMFSQVEWVWTRFNLNIWPYSILNLNSDFCKCFLEQALHNYLLQMQNFNLIFVYSVFVRISVF